MTDGPDAPDAAQRAEFEAAIKEGNFGRAFGAFQLAMIRRSLALLSQERYGVEWHRQPSSTAEFTGGLVSALDSMIEKQAETASYKLLVARDVIAAIARMQQALDREAPGPVPLPDTLGEILLLAVRIGNVEIMLGQTEGGFLDEYADLKWRQVLDFERRQKGAKGANDARERKRIEVLRAAQEIAKRNAALPNDDLAFRLKTQLKLPQSIRTITEWLRGWRKDCRLPRLR